MFDGQLERETFYIQGRHLYDPHGARVVLRGINLPLLDDWDFPAGSKLADLAQTGANAVRIQWYLAYPAAQRPAYGLADLDALLSQCATLGLVPILGLWDLTCQADAALLNSQLLPWWTSDEVVGVLNKHRQYLIVNPANELGFYRWAADPAAALLDFKEAYKGALTSLRQNLHMPLMLDAPDCGTSLDAWLALGQELIDHDPDHNLLLSVHAYWAAYDGLAYIQGAVDANLPIVFGEIANKQDETIDGETQFCFYDLDGLPEHHHPQQAFTYQGLLQTLLAQEIGWLAWCWWPDGCASRNIGVYDLDTGAYQGLSAPFGADIAGNPDYGLQASASRASIFDQDQAMGA